MDRNVNRDMSNVPAIYELQDCAEIATPNTHCKHVITSNKDEEFRVLRCNVDQLKQYGRKSKQKIVQTNFGEYSGGIKNLVSAQTGQSIPVSTYSFQSPSLKLNVFPLETKQSTCVLNSPKKCEVKAENVENTDSSEDKSVYHSETFRYKRKPAIMREEDVITIIYKPDKILRKGKALGQMLRAANSASRNEIETESKSMSKAKTLHAKPSLTCKKCPYTTFSRYCFIKHRQTHIIPKQCMLCSYIAKNKNDLKSHILDHFTKN